MDRSNRKILLASTFLAVPLAFVALSFSTGAQPKGGYVLPSQKVQPDRQVMATGQIVNSNDAGLKPGGIVQALGRSANAKPDESQVQPTGLLDGLFGNNQAVPRQNQANRPAPNWDGIPFHAPSRNNRVSNAPIRDLPPPAPVASTIPSLPTPPVMVQPPTQIVRRSVPKPIEAKPTSAKLSRVNPLSSRRALNQADAISSAQPLSRSTSNRRSGRQVMKPLDPSEIAARATSLGSANSDIALDELVPKVPRRILTKPEPPKVTPKKVVAKKVAPKKVAPKKVPTIEVAAAKPIKKPVPAPQVVSPKVVAKPKAVPAKTTLAAPAVKPKPAPLAPAPPKVVKTPSSVASHRAGPPETDFEPRRVMDTRPVRPMTIGHTMNVAMPIGSGVADPANNEASVATRPLPMNPSVPEERIAQRPQAFKTQVQPRPFQSDPYGARPFAAPAQNTVPQQHAVPPRNSVPQLNSAPIRQDLGNTYHPTPAAPIERTTPKVANGMRHDQKAAAGQTTVASELPGIRVATRGPREVTIRQTHQFEILVENRGSIDAKGVVVRASIPEWADMRGQNATAGEIAPQGKKGEERLVWTIDQLPAGASEKMFVRVKAMRSGTHGLDVDWTLAPQKSVTQIHVHEPELQLTIEGPSEIIFGESQSYKVRVLNPGDGIAPNVVFTLSPNSSTPQTQRIGDIPPGKEAQFEVELTAQDLGDLKIDGLASGDLELRADASKTIRVSAAKLEALFSGPEVKYQDTEAAYSLQVQNKGRTTSKNVMATLKLPVGVKYLGGLDGANQRGNVLQWEIESLSPGTTRDYQFRCNMNTTGDHTFAFECKGTAAGQAEVSISTQVESISDLVMTIKDPAAPAPVGSEVGYEIVIHNRGSRAATDVRAIAQFSHGIEPLRLKGHSGEILTGQVLFDPIAKIEPGQEVRLRVVAEAERAGHHRFRSEIRSGDTVLVAEEATHYMSPRKERISRRSSDEAAKTR